MDYKYNGSPKQTKVQNIHMLTATLGNNGIGIYKHDYDSICLLNHSHMYLTNTFCFLVINPLNNFTISYLLFY